MKIITLGETDSLLGHYLAQIRDRSIQKDSLRFRRNLERMGEIFAYEISKTLHYETVETETPLGIAECRVLTNPIVLATILYRQGRKHDGFVECKESCQLRFV